MKKLCIFLVSALMTVILFSGCTNTENSETTTSATTEFTSLTEASLVTETDETKDIPEGYLDGDIDYFEEVPNDWCYDFVEKGSNDNFDYEAKGMYLKKYFLGLKMIEPVVVLKITNKTSEVKEWDLYDIYIDVNSSVNTFARVGEVQPGETIYRCIPLAVDPINAVMENDVCIYSINNVRLRFDNDLTINVDFTKVTKPEV